MQGRPRMQASAKSLPRQCRPLETIGRQDPVRITCKEYVLPTASQAEVSLGLVTSVNAH